MTTLNELRAGLLAIAKRSVSLMPACTNEESTKLYLVLPFLGLLGYDFTNPYEVYPEHAADFAAERPNRVDLAVLSGGEPIVAIEVKRVGADLDDHAGQLAGYFNAIETVKLGIITNGIVYAFYVDCERPNMMDDEPFFTLDLETIASAGLADDEMLETLLSITKGNFDPGQMAEAAHVRLVKRRLRKVFVEEARTPSEGLCRFALDRIGIRNVRASAIERYYAPLVKAAFEEALVLPVVRKLQSEPGGGGAMGLGLNQGSQRVVTTEREIAIHAYVRRRLAFLVSEEAQFNAIEAVRYKDYVGKFAIYYENVRKGRLFDFIEGPDGYDKYIFPDPLGEIVTNNIYEIDDALRTVFLMRVRELGAAAQTHRLARIA